MRAVVKGNINSLLCSRVKQATLFRIFTHDTNKGCVRNPLPQFRPALTVVARLINVRTQIVELMTINGDIRGTPIKR